MIGIYKIENIINKKCYVGSSLDINNRWIRHKRALNNEKHHSIKLQRAFNKYGEDNFLFEIIEECDEGNLLEREQNYIDSFNSYENGYNSVPIAGNNKGMVHSEKTRNKIKMAGVGNKNMLNKKHTDETKETIRQKLKGRKLSDETKAKMSASRKGKVVSEDTKRKISESKKGKPLSEENKKALSLSHTGKKQSKEVVEHRAKMNTGKKRTDETKKKMSDSMKGIKKGPMSFERKLVISEKNSKKIAHMTNNGHIIKKYDSVKSCSLDLNIDPRRISDVLHGKTYKDYFFKFL